MATKAKRAAKHTFTPVMDRKAITEPQILAWATYLGASNMALSVKEIFRSGSKQNKKPDTVKSARALLSRINNYYGYDLPEGSVEAEANSFVGDIRDAIAKRHPRDWNIIAEESCWGDALLWVIAHVEDCKPVIDVGPRVKKTKAQLIREAKVKIQKELHPDRFMFHTKSNEFEIRVGFFYRNGSTNQTWIDNVLKVFPDADINRSDSFEIWQAWPRDSYWKVVFALPQIHAEAKQ